MSDIDKLRGFAREVLQNWPDGDVEGGELQDLAIKYGLLEGREVTEPCSEESCMCAGVGNLPGTCYRRTVLLTEGR